MSQVISQGFRTMYEILEVGTIKPGKSGTMENGTHYKANVKFRSKNIVEREDALVGVQEVENSLEFRILCADEAESIAVSEAIRKMRVLKTPFYISGDLPRKFQNQEIPSVDSFESGTDFLKKVEPLLQVKQAVKA